MQVTEVRVTVMRGEGKLRGYANIVLDGAFAVKGLKIIEGQKGFFVMMPSVVKKNGSRHDSAYPLNRPLHQHIEDAVITKYEDILYQESLQNEKGERNDKEGTEAGDASTGA